MQIDLTSISANVARLDALLNARLERPNTPTEQRDLWTLKVDAKRQLASLPDAAVDEAAGVILQQLQRSLA